MPIPKRTEAAPNHAVNEVFSLGRVLANRRKRIKLATIRETPPKTSPPAVESRGKPAT
jgi:hypothetical protein